MQFILHLIQLDESKNKSNWKISILVQIERLRASEHPLQYTTRSLILPETHLPHPHSLYYLVRFTYLLSPASLICVNRYKSQLKCHLYLLYSPRCLTHIVLLIQRVHYYQLWLRWELLKLTKIYILPFRVVYDRFCDVA